MALWQDDAAFVTDVTLMMTGAIDRGDLDVPRFQSEIGEVMAKYRTAALAEMQIGPILQEMSAVSLRHGVPLPASLTLAVKALAQVQLATADLDPALDPYDVAGKFLTALGGQAHGCHARSEDTGVSIAKVESTGPARDRGGRTPHRCPPWPKACGELPGQFAGGYGAPHGTASGARPDRCGKCSGQRTHGHVDGCGRVGTDHIRGRRRSADRWPGDRSAARALTMTMVYDAVRSRNEDFVPLRLIERNTAFSSRYAMTIIARPTSQRSTCRMKGRCGIVFVEALFIIRVSLLEGLLSTTSTLLTRRRS